MNNEFDITVIGGGVAGSACAYTASKLGLKTLLIEKSNYLGGLATGGLVIPMMKTESKNLNIDFYNVLISNCKNYSANIDYKNENAGWFNPILLKIVLENMILNSGAKILYETEVKNIKFNSDEIYQIFIKNNSPYIKNNEDILSLPIYAKYIVDGTGSGEICKILGAKFLNKNKKNQPATLRFILSNVNTEKFVEFLKNLNESEDKTSFEKNNNEWHFTTAYTWDTNSSWALEPYFAEAVRDGILKDTDREYFQLFSIANMPNSVAFNCPRLRDTQDTLFSHSNALIEARLAILRLADFMKKYIAGFENSYITNIAELTGTREDGRVDCEYLFTSDDIINPKTFSDKVLHSNYPIDIHSNDKNTSVLSGNFEYEFPLRSLKVKGFKNLFAIGKCAGADFDAHASLRIQKTCMSMGEAVGKAVANEISKIG